MADRWNPRKVTVDTVYPEKWFVPAGETIDDWPALVEHNSQHRVTLHPRGFLVRERGALSGTVVHAYVCPVHGVFDARVSREDMPDERACPMRARMPELVAETQDLSKSYFRTEVVDGWERPIRGEDGLVIVYCGLTSPWAGSFAGQGHAAGEVCS